MIVDRVSDLIGGTPLLRLHERDDGARLVLKLEQMNPLGTAKVRMARAMIDAAERQGLLRKNGHIVESTSGNTGLGLALVALERGYKFTAVVDGHAARDKIDAMRAMGANIEVVADTLATDARDKRAQEIAARDPTAFWTRQHDNPANAEGYNALADELVRDLGGKIDMLIGAVGTGGSLCGTARRLRQHGITPLVIGVEPVGSVIFGGPAQHYLQSGTGTPEGAEIGAVVDYNLIDDHRKVSDAQAFTSARWFARNRGVLVGGSAGGVLYAAAKLVERGGTVVAIACDGGERYLETIYDDQWITERGLHDPEVVTELDAVFAKRRVRPLSERWPQRPAVSDPRWFGER